MSETTYVRWQNVRHRRSQQSLWHIAGTSLNDRWARTGCGRRYRRTAHIETRETPPDEAEMCANCLIALESDPG